MGVGVEGEGEGEGEGNLGLGLCLGIGLPRPCGCHKSRRSAARYAERAPLGARRDSSEVILICCDREGDFFAMSVYNAELQKLAESVALSGLGLRLGPRAHGELRAEPRFAARERTTPRSLVFTPWRRCRALATAAIARWDNR